MSFLSKIFFGTDLGDEQKRGDALDAKLAQINSIDYAPGGKIYDTIAARDGTAAADQSYADAQQHLTTGATGNVSDQVYGAFKEGLAEGPNNFAAFYSKAADAIKKIIPNPLQFIPWWVWPVGVVALFLYMGGGRWLKGILKA